MVIEKKHNSALALFDTLRRNHTDSRISYSGVPLEHLLRTAHDRYTDPLIVDKYHNIRDPYARERVAAEDPIANTLIWGYAFRAWTEMIKFYETDQLEASEIGQNIRQLLKQIKFDQFAISVMAAIGTHGWCCGRRWIENGQFKYTIYTEYVARPEQFVRNGKNNEVTGIRVYTRPRLPLNRIQTNIAPYWDELDFKDPSCFFVCRGDKTSSFGFGYSRLEPVWDAITKLREESHSNAFRVRVFPISVVPADWNETQIAQFFEKVSRMDMGSAMVSISGKNPDGTLVKDLPIITWSSPGTSAAGTNSQGSTFGAGGAVSLTSEWVRVCAVTRHSIRYFTGNPGGALAAADVDSQQDLTTDIEEFKLYTDFITDFINWLAMQNVPIDLTPGFCIKSHWQWQRDEQLLAQAEMNAWQMDQQEQQTQSKQTQNQRWIENGGKWSGPNTPGRILGKAQEKRQIELFNRQKKLHDVQSQGMGGIQEDTGYGVKQIGTTPFPTASSKTSTQPIIPGQWIDITGSESGKWKRVKLSLDGTGVIAETTEGRTYHYDDVMAAEQAVGAIRDTGGHGIWELFRAPASVRELYPKGLAPQGEAKTGTGMFPYAGGAHFEPQYGLGDPDQGQGSTTGMEPSTMMDAELSPDQTEVNTDPAASEFASYIRPENPMSLAEREPATATRMVSSYLHPSQYGQKESSVASAQGKQTWEIARDKAAARSEQNKQAEHERQLKSAAKASPSPSSTASPNQPAQTQKQLETAGSFLKMSKHPSLRLLGRMFSLYGRKNESLADVSRKRFNEIATELVQHSFGNQQIDYIKTLLNHELNPTTNVPRLNAVAYGNGMAFDQPLYYPTMNGIVEEYACKKDWKKLVGKSGPLDLFHMNKKFTVGTYEIIGWDDITDLPVDKITYDEAKVQNACAELGLNSSRVIEKLARGAVPDISTEYYCDIKIHNGKRFQTNFRDISASFVEFGNCPDNKCVFEKL